MVVAPVQMPIWPVVGVPTLVTMPDVAGVEDVHVVPFDAKIFPLVNGATL